MLLKSTNILQFVKYNKSFRNFATSKTIAPVSKKVCIVGAGPAGFYAAQYILKHLNNTFVDIIEKLPVPYGLVRYGVAPDHPEVKNVINTFNKTAEHPNFHFYGNITLGKDISLKDLRSKYHAVLLTYGADEDRLLNIENENLPNVLSARQFVAWYNGLPGAENLSPNLKINTVTLLGQGNVAVDVARILLAPIDELRKTDISEHALAALADSTIKRVYLVGRRGPLQVAFTIKELREMLKIPNCTAVWRENDFDGVKDIAKDLQRPRKRLTELMLKSLSEQNQNIKSDKTFCPIFYRSPAKIITNNNYAGSVQYDVNTIKDDIAHATGESEIIPTELICRSIGYKSINVDPDINFNERKGFVNNSGGRVLKKGNASTTYEEGLYTSGWLATGPTGVILTTMSNSFAVADIICKDFESKVIASSEEKPGLAKDLAKFEAVTWNQWKKIDEFEIECGKKVNKPREKLVDIRRMLEIAK